MTLRQAQDGGAPAPTRGSAALAPRRETPVRPELRPVAQPRRGLRAAHVAVALAGVVAILLGQLVLSIAVADGAYRVSELQVQQRDLARQQRALGEQLQTLESPQNLARNARALGMVESGPLSYLNVGTGKIKGAKGAGLGSVAGSGGTVSNVLLEDVALIDPALPADSSDSGVADPSSDPATVGSDAVDPLPSGVLPSPRTH